MLSDVALLMWEGDCGFIPIVDTGRHVVGVITDRDICIAAGTRKRPPAHICARELMDHDVACCQTSDDVRAALLTMRQRGVRRLPVIGSDGVLAGVLSIDDVVVEAGSATSDVSSGDVVDTLKTICTYHLPTPQRHA
jgi:CBS domain-containing protein